MNGVRSFGNVLFLDCPRMPVRESILLGIGIGILDFIIIAPLATILTIYLPSHSNPYADESPIHFFLQATFLAPPFEEFLFRGLIFGMFSKIGGSTIAVFGSTALFALAHYDSWQHIVLVFPGGFLYAMARLKSGRLWPSMLSHGVFNGIATGLAVISH